ncbi:unnamed protein product [Haemonchus placei]|uniref:Uncharacterized protein n=1 Tax=Haemonchus placei TaxID=6290 RepID=A0A0N4WZQ9_HAEPC|nr:unnamed protein product [Haemonchus placei]
MKITPRNNCFCSDTSMATFRSEWSNFNLIATLLVISTLFILIGLLQSVELIEKKILLTMSRNWELLFFLSLSAVLHFFFLFSSHVFHPFSLFLLFCG